MARLVGVAAAPHAPLIVRDWNLVPPARQEALTSAFQAVGRRLSAEDPDIIILITSDHWVNFFISNYPSICIGVGEEHDGPPEPFLKDFPYELRGAPEFAGHLVKTALDSDFDPAVSHRLRTDHGFCIPLWRMALPRMPLIVPVIVNVVEAPFPTLKRCLAWGRLLAQAIASYPEDLKVAIFASGGLSHSIGEVTMGMVDQRFDEDCIRYFTAGAEAPLIDYLETALPETGNGGEEVRHWLMAHAAAGSQGFELISYIPEHQLYGGFGFASWNVA